MSKQHLGIDYHLNSASFGEQKRVDFECNLKENGSQMARVSHYNFNIANNVVPSAIAYSK